MHRINQQRHKRQRGSALVESGLTLVVFMFVIFGLMEFCRAVWVTNLLSHAAREATRYAMVRGRSSGHPATADAITTVAKTQAVGLGASDLHVNVSWIPDNKPGSAVKVVLGYTFGPMTNLMGSGTFSSTSQVIITQ